jgi:phosphoadenosine phosphosulfate reductase
MSSPSVSPISPEVDSAAGGSVAAPSRTDGAVAMTVQAIDPERVSAEERVRWAVANYGDRLIVTTSFGIQSAVMLHLVTRIAPGIPVVFVDTGYHFAETYRFADELTRRLQLNLKVYTPAITSARQEALFGRQWEQGLDGLARYNHVNKVEPMDRAVRELGAVAWLAGLRREQAATRADLPVVKVQNRVTKIHPIVDWTSRDVHRYLVMHELPYHPLWEQGYVSVGDWHSTAKLEAGMAPEQTRFRGMKRECGLHEHSGRVDFQI